MAAAAPRGLMRIVVVDEKPERRKLCLLLLLLAMWSCIPWPGSSGTGSVAPRQGSEEDGELGAWCCAAPAPGSYHRGALSPPGALLIPHCQPWQFLLGERVSGRAQQRALQGREIPEQNRKAAASLLHLALYPASPSSCCRDSDTPRSAAILPGTISVRQAEGCCPALPKRYHQWGPGHYRRVTISSC